MYQPVRCVAARCVVLHRTRRDPAPLASWRLTPAPRRAGPACPSGLAAEPATYSRSPPEAAPELQPAAWLLGEAGEGSVFAQVQDAATFHSMLTAGGEWLVLFYDATCGAACAQAAAAIRGAAPRLAEHRVRFLAVSCDSGAGAGTGKARHLRAWASQQ